MKKVENEKCFSHTLPKGLDRVARGGGQFFVLPCLPDQIFRA